MTVGKTRQATNNTGNLAFMSLFPLQDKISVHKIQGMILNHSLIHVLVLDGCGSVTH